MATVSPSTPPSDLKVLWTRLALFFAVIGVIGSLHLSINMGLKACPLCYYQRAFIMATMAVLTLGMFLPGLPKGALAVLALAPACAGCAVAALHTYLDWTGVLECPKGITGVLVAPHESLIVYLLLLAALLGDLFHRKQYVMQGLGALLLGYVLYTTSIKSVAPMPPTPRDAPLDGCRKPFQEKM